MKHLQWVCQVEFPEHNLFQILPIPFLGEHNGNKAFSTIFHNVKAILSFPF